MAYCGPVATVTGFFYVSVLISACLLQRLFDGCDARRMHGFGNLF